MNHSEKNIYDFIFVGNGASSALVLLALEKKGLLQNKRILILDGELKNRNDRTFCFWAEKQDPIIEDLLSIIHQSWDSMINSDGVSESISPYLYHCIRGIDLYKAAKAIQEKYRIEVFPFHTDIVASNSAGKYIVAKDNKYFAKHIFDSRPPDYYEPQREQVFLLQSFVGWLVKLENAIPNANAIHWMDFSIEQANHTQFMYILPFDQHHVLVEFTRFGSIPLLEEEAFPILLGYIQNRFGEFEIEETEMAAIPMSNCAMSHRNRQGVTLLGARAGHLKPTTGYAFKNMYMHARQIASEIEKNKEVDFQILDEMKTPEKKRFQFYDALLLIILSRWAHLGKPLFEALLTRIKTPLLLKFLGHETTLKEEVTIFYQLPWRPFLRALLVWGSQHARIIGIFAFLVVYILMGNEVNQHFDWGLIILLIGLLVVGIPHGALDHVIESCKLGTKRFINFLGLYVLLMGLMTMIWFYNPAWALVIFLVYSAVHFGQTDGIEWELSNVVSWLWGGSLLGFILGTHYSESMSILSAMGYLGDFPEIGFWILIPWAIYAAYNSKWKMLLTMIWISMTAFIPLISAFGLYFIFQHSALGWMHLKEQFKMTHFAMWKQSLLFQMGAWLFLILFFLFWPTSTSNNLNKWGVFFVFLSSLSFPHVLAMIRFYKRSTRVIV
ncbi:MAG: hypothetical protein RL521_560 [Bacteroidota bacterium]|jgi:lycopene beta-cyclase